MKKNVLIVIASLFLCLSLLPNLVVQAASFPSNDYWGISAKNFEDNYHVPKDNLPTEGVFNNTESIDHIRFNNEFLWAAFVDNVCIWVDTFETTYKIGNESYTIKVPRTQNPTTWITGEPLNNTNLAGDADWTGDYGWEFIGWSNSATSNTLTSDTAVSSSKSYFAVYKRVLTATFSSEDADSGTSGVENNKIVLEQYYNSGNITTKEITLPTPTYTKNTYPAVGWQDEAGAYYNKNSAYQFYRLNMHFTATYTPPHLNFASSVTTSDGIGTVIGFEASTITDPQGNSYTFDPTSKALGYTESHTFYDAVGNSYEANIKMTKNSGGYTSYTITNLPDATTVTTGWAKKVIYTTDYVPNVSGFYKEVYTSGAKRYVAAIDVSFNMNQVTNPGLAYFKSTCGGENYNATGYPHITPSSAITNTVKYVREAKIQGKDWATTTFRMWSDTFYSVSGSMNEAEYMVLENYNGLNGNGW